MWKVLYKQFVEKDAKVQYEYERYVMEHIDEHYTNRLRQWKILWKLNVHYRIKRKDTPMLYFDNIATERYTVIPTGIDNGVVGGVESMTLQAKEEFIEPGQRLRERILYGKKAGTKILLCPYAGTGDVYLSAMYMKDFVEKNNINNYIVCVIGVGNSKVVSLFDIENVEILSQREADCLIRLAMFLDLDNQDIFIIHHDAPQVYFGVLENFRNINQLNFTDLFVNVVFGHGPEEGKQLPEFRNDQKMISKLFRKYDLKKGKTVVLSPYANTLSLLPHWVWVQIAKELTEKGYTVVTNCGSEREQPITGTKAVYYEYDISVPFLEQCGYFIGIRSGLCDVISTAQCRKVIIYQPYLFWGEQTAFEYFSLKNIGFCDDSIELEYEGVEFLDLIDRVMLAVENGEVVNIPKKRSILAQKKIRTIIVQAGGRGSRMENLTDNKPKALVPIKNLPMIFHLFYKFPKARFVIIGDYKIDVLKRYLNAFAKVDYTIVDAGGKKGTCAGIRDALLEVPEDEPFMIIWSDLILADSFDLDWIIGGNYVGISEDFSCRWKFENGCFIEQNSKEFGVAGLFSFENKALLNGIPNEGELVRWLSKQNDFSFRTVGLKGAKEYGLKEEYEKLKTEKCRPFNQMEIYRGTIIKRPLDKQGEKLAERENAWYQYAESVNFTSIPRIISYKPLVMEHIEGKNLYEYKDISYNEKLKLLEKTIACIRKLHSTERMDFDFYSYEEAYIGKTISRLEKVKDLVPYAREPVIVINGKKCRNFYGHVDEVKNLFKAYMPTSFSFIHGDCTFSNIMIRDDRDAVLIDPRGYFGNTELFGDEAYDWAKLYYSIVGNYDQFNLKHFQLKFEGEEIKLDIQSSGWEELEDAFFDLIGSEFTRKQIKLIHSIIWLSLTTYAWDNYDSICGAYYNGLYYLEDVL